MSDALRAELARVASRLGADGVEFVLERPRDAGHGDLATNLAMVLAKRERANPRQDRRAGARRSCSSRPSWSRGPRSPGPASSTSGWPQDQLAAGAPRASSTQGPAYGRSTAGAGPQGQRRVRLRQSRPDRSTSATAAGPRWATPSPRCSSGPGTRSPASSTSTTPGVQIDRWPQSLWARVREARGPPGGDSRGRLPRRVPARECARGARARRARRSPTCRAEEGIRRCRALGARHPARRSRTATSREFGVRFDVMSLGAGASTTRAGSSARSSCSPSARAHVTRPRARSGSAPPSSATTRTACSARATARFTYLVPDIAYHIDKHERGFDRVIDVWGADHHGYIPRMRAVLAALGLSAGVLRRGAGAAGQGGAGRGRGEDVEAARRVRHPARPVRGGRRGRGALLLPHARRAPARSTSTWTSPSGRPTRTRSSTSRWRTRG